MSLLEPAVFEIIARFSLPNTVLKSSNLVRVLAEKTLQLGFVNVLSLSKI